MRRGMPRGPEDAERTSATCARCGSARGVLACVDLGAGGCDLQVGIFSFLALREFITLAHTRRSDHRSLILAFFVVLPLQYVIVAWRSFDLFTVFIPVYVFLAIPVVSALAGDPERFLERNAKIQWGIMVCVYGLSHAPALLLLELPRYAERGAFLLFFLVMVAGRAHIAQEAGQPLGCAAARWRATSTARSRSAAGPARRPPRWSAALWSGSRR